MKGALLLNLGTPCTPSVSDVRRYLAEFLMDPAVIDLPYLLRFFLVYFLILPRRPKLSSEAYKLIWTKRGSPLRFHLWDLVQGVQKKLETTCSLGQDSWKILPAMRYGEPSIYSAFCEFQKRGVSEVVVFPLYPQYSMAATESSVQACLKIGKKFFPQIALSFIPPFFDETFFIEAFSQVAQDSLKSFAFDHMLFSFHGLPERHIKKGDSQNFCRFQDICCEQVGSQNANCYRAHCFATAKALAQKLGLSKENYTVCFQSRLGRTPWIKPYTDVLYKKLAEGGVRRLAVMCPAFVSDCLETLEEIQIRGRGQFLQYGGEDFKMVPSLNASPLWIHAVSHLLLR